MKSARRPAALLDPSISWLMGIAVTCLLVVLGLKVFFDNLQEELREKSANERARLFIGEEIVHGIAEIEKHLYQMHSATNRAGIKRITLVIDASLAKLRHDLAVLKDGGSVRREIYLNIEGRDEMVSEVVYRPDPQEAGYVMELIELGPLLDEVDKKSRELEALQISGRDYQADDDLGKFFAWHGELDVFIKHIPPYFARLNENANRLFFDSSARLRELEAELAAQRARLKQVEMGAMALVMILAGLLGMFFLRRINAANRNLEAALEEMRSAKDAAERASRAKSEFVSRMSHELRTPLNAIIGFAELLDAEPLSPSHKNYVNLINSSGKHLMELINAVLDHAKIESGNMTLERIAFDFHAAIDAVRTIVNERATAKGLDFVATIDAGLPRFVIGDPTRLRQILINLMVNAVKFTEQGSVELRVAPEDDRIIFSVRDTGIGMNETALSRLFKPFSQADDSVTRKYGGTGLGLMISKELIEAMGGSIEVESASGVGTVFWFWLPLQAADARPDDEARPAPSVRQQDVAILVQGRVLLVDDNRVNQQLAGAMLDRLGLAYDFADNGAHALRRLASADYSLVLMDMEMPEMDGVTATREYRREEAEKGRTRLPIIAMTANALQEDRERCFAAGMDGYISKPISLSALQDELRRIFGGAAVSQPAMAASGTIAGGVFDRGRAIEMMGDEELFQQLAGMYVTDAPGYLHEIDDALAAADSARLARAAHTLKGLFATFAAAPGEAVARQLEQTAHQGATESCTELVQQVRAQAEALAAALAAG